MKILLIMDPGIPVPPHLYGGHERLVYMFAEEYKRLGHDVTLLAGPQSRCSGKTITFGINDLDRPKIQKAKEIIFVWKYLHKKKNTFDIIHNFGRLIYLAPVLNNKVKKIMTYGRRVTRSGILFMNKIPHKNLIFTACSNYCVSTGNVAGRWETIYNAINFSQYELNDSVNDTAPLMFLGRLDQVKGAHTAIKIAKTTGNKLVIGGNIPDTADSRKYFKEEIEPFIDNEQIIYLGPLNDAEKNLHLGLAKALLFPIEWDEPFGMVMIEAMACGTPVIGFNRGAVSEIIQNGVNGYLVNTLPEIIDAVSKIGQIDRRGCRISASNRFNVDIIAGNYLKLVENPALFNHL